MSIIYYDYRNIPGTNNPLLIEEKLLPNVGILNFYDETKISLAHTIIAHLGDAEQLEKILDNSFPSSSIKRQIFILISSTPNTYQENESKIIKESQDGKSRAILFVRDLDILKQDDIIPKVISLSFEQAEKIITEKSALSLEWKADPFFHNTDRLIAIYILCQAFVNICNLDSINIADLGASSKRISNLVFTNKPIVNISDEKLRELQDTVMSSIWWKSSLTGKTYTSEEVSTWHNLKEKSLLQWKSHIQNNQEQGLLQDFFTAIDQEKISPIKVASIYLKIADFFTQD